jgi:hypothetical protein
VTAEDFGRVPAPGWRDRRVPERCECLCGGTLERSPYEATAVVVRRHQRTRQHREWWERVRADWY